MELEIDKIRVPEAKMDKILGLFQYDTSKIRTDVKLPEKYEAPNDEIIWYRVIDHDRNDLDKKESRKIGVGYYLI